MSLTNIKEIIDEPLIIIFDADIVDGRKIRSEQNIIYWHPAPRFTKPVLYTHGEKQKLFTLEQDD